MHSVKAKSTPALGFLTVLEHPQHGLFGGYLVLNSTGRPLEFHCTTPIRPNRAQEILYGPTLQAFLYGEQIGRPLLAKGKHAPLFVCTDRRPVLALREHVEVPVALILPESDADDDSDADTGRMQQRPFRRIDGPHPGPSQPGPSPSRHDELLAFDHGSNHLAVPETSAGDRPLIQERLGDIPPSFDLAEPFSRIRQAIEEAQQAVR